MTQALPPVAKTFLLECKKCNTERYHKVLAHTTDTSAKVECEVCHSKKTFKMENSKKRKTAALESKAKKASAKENPTWLQLKEELGEKPSVKYSIREKFKVHTPIDHINFGLGFVTVCFDHRIDVVFEDGIKSLVHNR